MTVPIPRAYLDSGDVGSCSGAGVRYASSDIPGQEFSVTAYLDSYVKLDIGGFEDRETAFKPKILLRRHRKSADVEAVLGGLAVNDWGRGQLT